MIEQGETIRGRGLKAIKLAREMALEQEESHDVAVGSESYAFCVDTMVHYLRSLDPKLWKVRYSLSRLLIPLCIIVHRHPSLHWTRGREAWINSCNSLFRTNDGTQRTKTWFIKVSTIFETLINTILTQMKWG